MTAIIYELKKMADFIESQTAREVAIDFYTSEIGFSHDEAVRNVDGFGVRVEKIGHTAWAQGRAIRSGMPVSMLEFFDVKKYLDKYRNNPLVSFYVYNDEEYVITDFIPF